MISRRPGAVRGRYGPPQSGKGLSRKVDGVPPLEKAVGACEAGVEDGGSTIDGGTGAGVGSCENSNGTCALGQAQNHAAEVAALARVSRLALGRAVVLAPR